jgi:hypothetical protein
MGRRHAGNNISGASRGLGGSNLEPAGCRYCAQTGPTTPGLVTPVSRDTWTCPLADTKPARWRPPDLPIGSHRNCVSSCVRTSSIVAVMVGVRAAPGR